MSTRIILKFFAFMIMFAHGSIPVLADEPIRVGSKVFTESVILGEMLTHVGQTSGHSTIHRKELGGTGVVWKALTGGEIDLYPDYTGTIAEAILKSPGLGDLEEIRRRLELEGVGVTNSLGFENKYALAVKREFAKNQGLTKISDLIKHPEYVLGFSNEFLVRSDGWPKLKQRYQLPQTTARGFEHALAYSAIEAGDVKVIDVYTTDATIRKHDLQILEDDLRFFPDYRAVILYRLDLKQRAPRYWEALKALEGRISNEQMLTMNERVELKGLSESAAAAEFLQIDSSKPMNTEKEPQLISRILARTWEHLGLVLVSMIAAIIAAIPLGIVSAKNPKWSFWLLGTVEVLQTIPGLALLILLIAPMRWLGLPGIGAAPAIAALFLYSLLPIMRNTMAGLQGIPLSIRESAEALGLSAWTRLLQIELPLATRSILAGIKTTAVINVGYASLGGLIGAGGYGQTIMQGLRLSDDALMLEGAIPAALLALIMKWLFELAERFLIPRGWAIN